MSSSTANLDRLAIRVHWRLHTGDLTVRDNAGDGCLASGLFAIFQDLPQEGPEHNNRTVNAAHAKQTIVLRKDFTNAIRWQHALEGQSLGFQERIGNLPEIDRASIWRIWY